MGRLYRRQGNAQSLYPDMEMKVHGSHKERVKAPMSRRHALLRAIGTERVQH
jgi:hypothetical protein